MKHLVLPLGLIVAFVLAWLVPHWGMALSERGLMPWLVATIFVINGYQVRLAEMPLAFDFLKAVLMTAIISLLLGPWLGTLLAQGLSLSGGEWLGLVVIGCVPPTLSSCIVLTQSVGGRAVWALVLSLLLNILGVVSMPFMLAWVLQGGESIEIDPCSLLFKLGLIVLLPFISGILLQRFCSMRREPKCLPYVPLFCIVAGVWLAMADSAGAFQAIELGSLIRITLAVLLLHLLLLILNWWGGLLLGVDRGGRVAMTLAGSQKTLPVAVSVLAVLGGPVGDALLVCLLFHFSTLFIDALIVPYMGGRHASVRTQSK